MIEILSSTLYLIALVLSTLLGLTLVATVGLVVMTMAAEMHGKE